MSENGSLLPVLKQHFGFDSFLPLQEEIIRDSLEGRDVFALLPTGGGKSLCYQLPALMREGLTVVVSPLIALMKDQVDALKAGGIAATFLNSSLDSREIWERGRALNEGKYRLLYVAPERSDARLRRGDAALERGADRDGRGALRERVGARLPAGVPAVGCICGASFPETPLMALTATATERVRADIVQQLGLREPAVPRRQLQPAEPDVHVARNEPVLPGPGVRAGAAERERDHVLPQPERRRRRWRSG